MCVCAGLGGTEDDGGETDWIEHLNEIRWLEPLMLLHQLL